MKRLYESILSTDLENELDDLVEINDIDDLFGCKDWGQVKSFKNNNLILNVDIKEPKEVYINDYLVKHKLKSIDFGKSEICIHHDGNGLKNIDLKAQILDFRYEKQCELKNVHLICDQLIFYMNDAGVKLNKCVLDAEKILCEYAYIDSIRSIINTHNLTMVIRANDLRANNKLRQFIEAVDLVDFKSGSYKIRGQALMEQHQKLLATIDPMNALGLSGKINEIVIKPTPWMPGIIMTKIKPSRDDYEMANGWCVRAT